MIPAAFDYHRPNDLDGVISLLQEHGDDARVIAGGHSLIPLMKLRMAEVPHLIDLQSISCLLYTSPSPRDATLTRMPSSA